MLIFSWVFSGFTNNFAYVIYKGVENMILYQLSVINKNGDVHKLIQTGKLIQHYFNGVLITDVVEDNSDDAKLWFRLTRYEIANEKD